MSEMCGKELGKHGVTVLSLWPGLVQTEHIMEMKDTLEKAKVVCHPWYYLISPCPCQTVLVLYIVKLS